MLTLSSKRHCAVMNKVNIIFIVSEASRNSSVLWVDFNVVTTWVLQDHVTHTHWSIKTFPSNHYKKIDCKTMNTFCLWSEFDLFGLIAFRKSGISKSFCGSHVWGEPTGSQPARPEEVSNAHGLIRHGLKGAMCPTWNFLECHHLGMWYLFFIILYSNFPNPCFSLLAC